MKTYRLKQLAQLLETVNEDEFYMGIWGRDMPCGFRGCAIGWAIHAQLFQGLTWNYDTERKMPVYGDLDNFNAVAAVFQITEFEARNLFSGANNMDKTPKEVARDIEDFIHTKVIQNAPRVD